MGIPGLGATSAERRGRRSRALAWLVLVVVAACNPSQVGPNGSAAPPRTGPGTAVSASSAPTTPPAGSRSASAGGNSPTQSEPAPASASVSTTFDPSGLNVAFEEVVGGLTAPLAIVNAHDGSGRLFIVEQGGQVRVVRNGRVEASPFLDISREISSGGERGLLGLAFAPTFPADGRIFVDYTDRNGDTHVSSFRVDPARPDRVDPATEQAILFQKQPFPNHNGGAVVFGPDRNLYVAFGDGGSGGDPQGNGQKLTTFLAKIVRIDVSRSNGGKAYAIPPDNPYADASDGRKPEIWLSGLRNPWRMSFDRATGDLWIGDVGQDAWEEVDVQRAGVPGGTNFGWNRMEGSHCYQPQTGCEEPSLTMPLTDYGHDQGCTVIGGDVYRGTAQPALVGGYVFADYCSGRVWAIDPATNAYRTPTVVAETGHSFAAFGEDEDGELYAVDINAGTLLRVTASR